MDRTAEPKRRIFLEIRKKGWNIYKATDLRARSEEDIIRLGPIANWKDLLRDGQWFTLHAKAPNPKDPWQVRTLDLSRRTDLLTASRKLLGRTQDVKIKDFHFYGELAYFFSVYSPKFIDIEWMPLDAFFAEVLEALPDISSALTEAAETPASRSSTNRAFRPTFTPLSRGRLRCNWRGGGIVKQGSVDSCRRQFLSQAPG